LNAVMAHWQVTTDRIRSRLWDGLLIVYNCYSGDTHCVDSVGAAIFAALQRQGRATESEICHLVGIELGEAGTSVATARAALDDLERLRLVKRLP
jgi:PqqD family protein of HPr-rel-A system